MNKSTHQVPTENMVVSAITWLKRQWQIFFSEIKVVKATTITVITILFPSMMCVVILYLSIKIRVRSKYLLQFEKYA